ncbi:uL30 family ribosomal protein [Candidatus Woesearchaeota archaeon]|nr:uL30 family ribosomal protein [Candidatus Woesearchaeota archaeon]
MEKEKNQKLAIIRVRGLTGVKIGIDQTLKKLKLYKKNYCVVVPKNQSYLGMIRKAKDYVTWGEIDEKTYNALTGKRGEEYTAKVSDKKGKINYGKFIDIGGKKIKNFFRLNSPKKGYGRKGVKASFTEGGALGYRGEKINDILSRMI